MPKRTGTDLSIGEVARRAGIQSSAIRYYETERLLPKARRINGRRVYDDGVLDQLAVIALGRSAGFTIAELRTLLTGLRGRAPSARWKTLTANKRVEIEERIAELERMKEILGLLDGCRCPTLADCGRALRS